MKVEICKSVDIETEVTIDIDDITSAISDYGAECQIVAMNDAPQRQRSRAVLSLCNAWWQTLSAITDEMIAQVEPHNRKTVYDALSKQLERFKEAAQ